MVGIWWFSSVLHRNVCWGYSLESPRRGDSNGYPQHMLVWRNKQNYPLIIIKYPSYLFHWDSYTVELERYIDHTFTLCVCMYVCACLYACIWAYVADFITRGINVSIIASPSLNNDNCQIKWNRTSVIHHFSFYSCSTSCPCCPSIIL